MRINDITDKIFVINLEQHIERRRLIELKLESNEIEFEIFVGVDGFDKKHDSLCKKLLEKPAIKSRGAIGLLLTYRHLLQKIIKNKYNSVIILEDDVSLHYNFDELVNRLGPLAKAIDKYGMIYLGANQTKLMTQQKKIIELVDSNQITFGNYVVHANNTYKPYGTYALMISRNFAIKLYEKIKVETTITEPIDGITYNVGKNNAIVVYPHLFIPDVTDSINIGYREQLEFCET